MTAATLLDPRWAAVRAGLSSGWIETRQQFAEPAALVATLIFPVLYAVILVLLRGKTVPGTHFALGAMVLPSLLGMSIAFGGLVGPTIAIAYDHEDGTLLRAKATPNGMLGYLIGKIVKFALTTLVGLVLLVILGLIPGVIVASDLVFDARTWLMLALIFVGGMMSTVPIALALGSLMKSTAQSGLVALAVALLIAPSGIFYPITALPMWMQWVGQAFPMYWMGLGARSALLPAAMAAAEIGASWRSVETFIVLGVWALIGILLAPILLGRMARRQSGSTLAAARERVMSKGY
ncbi:MAG TPA: ABC transporter permease [Steroidobacteraceae bacterium]|jgi:ABC-2 type transport system permease protein|nr:ABC transporter permease [Steroidobacteraceae bacterium]